MKTNRINTTQPDSVHRKPRWRGSDGYLQSVIDSLQDELVVIDRDYRILEVNQALLRRHGMKKSDVIGRYCYEISHGTPNRCTPPRDDCPINVVLKTGKPARVTHLHMYQVGGQDKARYVDVVASPILDEGGNIVAITELMRDVTDKMEMELKVDKVQRDLTVLNNIASVVSRSLDLDTVLNTALDRTLEIMNKSIGGILLLDEEKKMLRYAAHRGLSERYVREVCCSLGEGIAGRVALTGEAIVQEDVLKDPRLGYADVVAAEGLRAFASVPLRSKKKVLGVINIASHEIYQFSFEDIELLSSIAAQIAIAVENAQLHQKVQRQDEFRGELLREIFAAQEEDRRRIARELHDETTQTLTSMATSLEAVARKLPPSCEDARTTLRKWQIIAAAALDEIYRLIYELRPSLLDDLGLAPAMRWLADTILKQEGIKVNFKITGREKRLSSDREITLFRVVQEAMRNIARHARAKSAEVTLNFKPKFVEACVKDDGTGFDVQNAIRSKDRPRGLGLLGMKERVELVGGTLNIESSSGEGSKISIRIPIN